MDPAQVVPGLPSIEPHQFLNPIWKPAYTKALLDALPSADAVVVRTARQVGTLQVGYDGLVPLGGKEALDLKAGPSVRGMGSILGPGALCMLNLSRWLLEPRRHDSILLFRASLESCEALGNVDEAPAHIEQ